MCLFYFLKRDFDYTLPNADEYDNAIPCNYNMFIVYKSGKIGLCKTENGESKIVCDTEYDLIDCVEDNLLLSNHKHIFYYNLHTAASKQFTEVEIEDPYIYACDKEYQYIIHQDSTETVYQRRYTEHNKSWFKFCGNTDKGPVFYDYHNAIYIYPSEGRHGYYEDDLHHPLIINQENVLNVVLGENGLGIIDSFGNTIIDNDYDEIAVELNLSAANKNSSVKKTVAIRKAKFNKETISDISEW